MQAWNNPAAAEKALCAALTKAGVHCVRGFAGAGQVPCRIFTVWDGGLARVEALLCCAENGSAAGMFSALLQSMEKCGLANQIQSVFCSEALRQDGCSWRICSLELRK